MRRLVELILAITDLAEAELSGLRLGIERLIGSALLMLAVFVFAVGGAIITGVGVFHYLRPPLGTAGAITFMGICGLILAGILAYWLQQRAREEDDDYPPTETSP